MCRVAVAPLVYRSERFCSLLIVIACIVALAVGWTQDSHVMLGEVASPSVSLFSGEGQGCIRRRFFCTGYFRVVSRRIHCRHAQPRALPWSLYLRSLYSTMSTVMQQAAATPVAILRLRGKTHSRAIRAHRHGARRQVSCAASPAEAIKDKRIPVTILTGFLG